MASDLPAARQPAAQQPAARSKASTRILIGIGVIMIVSYTIYRLRYAAENLPFDPGLPFPVKDVTGDSAPELQSTMRAAFLSRRSVRLVGVRDDGTPDQDAKPKTYEAWPLHGLERERAILTVDRLIASARNQPADQRDSETCQTLASWVAARTLIQQGRVFVTDGLVMALRSRAPIHDWNVVLFSKNGRNRVLYAPIDSAEFDYVRAAATADPATFDPR